MNNDYKELPKSYYNIDEFIMINLINCEDTHSFTHRLWERWKKNMPTTKFDAQQDAWQVVAQMQEERK